MLGMPTLIVLIGAAFSSRLVLMIAVLIAIGLSLHVYFRSDQLALKAMHAAPVSEADAPTLYRIVRELSSTAKQPVPQIYVSPTNAPNAFATSRNSRHSTVCCSSGLLRILDERELRAVLGHELSHIYSRDSRVSSVAGALAATMSGLGALAFVAVAPEDRRDGFQIVAMLVAAVLAPFAGMMIKLTVSSSKEYEADRNGAALADDPGALASALRKIDGGIRAAPLPPYPGLLVQSHMMIANPFREGDRMTRLFATHPHLADRIARLEQMSDPPNT
ncbi:M48 family metalloprotease [Nocardia asteroides]|uniref:M48 family metalloprotease n=1 Tax=Nocardia asteroides TaxID=1824 RepID=UPI0037C7C96A